MTQIQQRLRVVPTKNGSLVLVSLHYMYLTLPAKLSLYEDACRNGDTILCNISVS